MAIRDHADLRLCLFLSGGIVTKSNQPQSVSHPFGIIEVKKGDSGTPTWSNPFNPTSVEAKMPMPSLFTGMKQEIASFLA